MPVAVESLSSVADADTYFGNRIAAYATAWTAATSDQKQQALNDATRIIDMFRYIGAKTETDQSFEWPRSGILNQDSDVSPDGVLYAQYEIALSLLKGFDVEREQRNQGVRSRSFAAVSTTYTDTKTEWLSLGIPSYTAWTYLQRYFDRSFNDSIKLSRVS